MEKVLLFMLLWLQLITRDTNGAVLNDWRTDDVVVDQHNAYRGDKVLRVDTPQEADFQKLSKLLHEVLPVPEVDVWREPTTSMRSADIYVRKHQLSNITHALRENELFSSSFIEDVQDLVDQEFDAEYSTERTKRAVRYAVNGELNVVNKFPRYGDILKWQQELKRLFPHLVTLYNIGKTYEQREMQVIRVGKDVGRWKPAIFIDATMHAREWIAPATAIYVIDYLLTRYWNSSSPVMQYVDKIDWYFLVVANPDGYEYTHTHFRLWRKNRRPLPPPPGRLYPCTGVDLNRNWGFNWGGENASPEPCDIMYRGPRAMSEPEVQNIANFMLDRNDCLRFYISLHSYTQFWFTRWSFADVLPPDHHELLDLAKRGVEAINQTHGHVYDAGTAPRLLYVFSGGSSDWAKGEAHIKYSYLIELRDRGEFGFLLPESQIIPTGEEIWAGLDVVAQRALLKYPVSVPIGEENQDGGGSNTSSTTTSQQPQHTSLPQTEVPPTVYPERPLDGAVNTNTESPLLHSTPPSSEGGDDVTSDNHDVIDDDVKNDENSDKNENPDLSDSNIGGNNDQNDVNIAAVSSSGTRVVTPAGGSQNVLLAEVLISIVATVINQLTS